MDGSDFTRDRISDLPNQLLTRILSLLPTEEAVRTCILSKRWINVWASVPILVFDNHKHPTDDLTDEEFLKREVKFLAFVCG
jgi:F-box domain